MHRSVESLGWRTSAMPPVAEERRGGAGGLPLATLLVCAVLGLRIAYLVLFSGWELVGDEAHYWEWSRRPDLSYYTKGPGIAWTIGLSTAIFGDSAAAVRLPSAIAAAVMALAGSRLARRITGGDERSATFAAAALMLAPGYFATAQLATTDVFYAAAWVVAALALWRAVEPSATTGQRLGAWAAVGAAIGVGCLFKYTTLFAVVGIASFLYVERRRVTRDRTLLAGIALSAAAVAVLCSPMIWWNAKHGWPTIAHQIGRLRLPGGDESVSLAWSPLWFPTFVGAQFALLGGVGGVLIGMAIARSRRPDGPAPVGRTLLVCFAAPILLFYTALSLFRATQGNWAIAAFTTPLVLVGIEAADATRRAGARSIFRSLWDWYVGIGIVVAIVLLIGPAVTRLPVLSRFEGIRRVSDRVSGAQARAQALDELIDAVTAAGAEPPLVIVSGYQEASLLAFYLPGRPVVYCAASRLGSRPNPYDYFADTDLADPSLIGRDAILVGGDVGRWQQRFNFASVVPADGHRKTFLARAYAGPATRATTRSGL